MEWKWHEDGGRPVRVEVGGTAYSPKAGLRLEDVARYSEAMADAGDVFGVLYRAKYGFEAGTADYVGAAARLRELVRELRQAEAELARVSHDFSTFFEPAGLSQAFGGNGDRFHQFLEEALPRLAALARANLSGGA